MKRVLGFLALLFALPALAQDRANPFEFRKDNLIAQVPKVEVPAEAPKADPPPPKQFPRGAKPTPPAKLFAAPRHKIVSATLSQIAYVPAKLDYWGNNQYGCCVTSSEAFARACQKPEIFISSSVCIGWARQHGFLNGADLSEVMDAMARSGFSQDGHIYGCGSYTSVNYSDEENLQNALSIAPVNVAIDADALPSGAGNNQGWYSLGTRAYRNTDHCVDICGFGTAEYLYQQLNVPLPAALAGKKGYLVYTWSTIGFVDKKWIDNTVVEAWLRNPNTTVDGVGLPNPGTGASAPSITSATTATATTGVPFTFQIAATNTPTSYIAANLPVGLTVSTTTGTISGTPTLPGATAVSVGATNAAGTGTSVLTITVVGVPVPPVPPVPPIPPTPTPIPGKQITILPDGSKVITDVTYIPAPIDPKKALENAIQQLQALKDNLPNNPPTPNDPPKPAPAPVIPPAVQAPKVSTGSWQIQAVRGPLGGIRQQWVWVEGDPNCASGNCPQR